MSLRNYGGGELAIVAQVRCQLSKGGLSVDSQLQVERDAPVDLLLGTDTLSQLGFSLTERDEGDV